MDDPTQRPLPDLRASDADRERAATLLGRAASDGRLDVDELEERLQLAYASRTHGELERLLADVGGGPKLPTPAPPRTGSPSLASCGRPPVAPRGSCR